MIEKFINNELSEKEVDNMIEKFFEMKKEKEFRAKWKGIIKENNNSKSMKIVKFLRHYAYRSVAAASLVIFIGAYIFYFYIKNTAPLSNDYATTAKGSNKDFIRAESLINSYNIDEEKNQSLYEKSISGYYANGYYDKALTEAKKLLKKQPEVVTDRILVIAAFSAFKELDSSKAIEYLRYIDSDSKYYPISQKLLKLIDNTKEFELPEQSK